MQVVRANPAHLFVKSALYCARTRGDFFTAANLADEDGMPQIATILRTAVSAINTTDQAALTFQSIASDGFLDVVRPLSLLGGRLRGAQQVPFEQKFPVAGTGATAYWVGEGQPIPVSKLSLEGEALAPTKLNVVVVVSDAILRLAAPASEAAIQASLVGSVALATDEAFLSTSAGIAGVQPAGILNGVSPSTSTGDPSADLAALIEGFAGNLETAFFVTNPICATRLALKRDTHGAYIFPDAGPRGGSVLGVPLLTSTAVPIDTAGDVFALIDPTGVQYADEGAQLATSDQSALAMSDSPTSPSQFVSL